MRFKIIIVDITNDENIYDPYMKMIKLLINEKSLSRL